MLNFRKGKYMKLIEYRGGRIAWVCSRTPHKPVRMWRNAMSFLNSIGRVESILKIPLDFWATIIIINLWATKVR